MSRQPVVAFYDAENESTVPIWDSGIVDAGTTSPELSILIWNNRDGSEDVSDMQETKITTTDNQGDVLDIVKEKWVEVRIDSDPGDTFTPVGGTETKVVTAADQEEGIIKGTNNSGNIEDTDNYAKVSLRAKPPLNSRAGKRQYKVRVSYYYT